MEIVLSEYGLAFLFGLAAFVTFIIVNFFSYSLKSKSYDEAKAELTAKSQTHNKKKNHHGKSSRASTPHLSIGKFRNKNGFCSNLNRQISHNS